MKKSERAALVQQRLAELYPDPPIPLDHSNPFTLLIAVLLSAQCTDERVNQVTPKLFKLGRSAKKMATVPVDTIREIIRPCGLSPQKSKRLPSFPRFWFSNTAARFQTRLRTWKHCPELGTRRRA